MRETRFGRWFLSTRIWRTYVLAESLETLARLAGDRVEAGAHILDIGCGQGTAAALLDTGFRPSRITGIDIDAELIARGRAQSEDTPLSAELSLTQGCATDIPLDDHAVDLVLCHQLLHHMVAQREALAEIRRVLRPGGLLLVAESCRCFIESSLVRALFRHPSESQRDAAGYVELVRLAGFRLEEADVVTESPWWSLPDLGLKQRFATRLCADSAIEPTEVLGVAEKP
ncbi:MAG: class I SAM-dependent methyltransferase [Thiohalocapsa sp.]